jgi:tetraacyldisaccharide 4'-kinase
VKLPPAWRDRIAAWPVEARFDDAVELGTVLERAVSR